jgi:hypothetical protein
MTDPAILALACFCGMQMPVQGCGFLIRQLVPTSTEMRPTVAGNQSVIMDVVMHLVSLCGTNICCRKAHETFATHVI